MVRKSDCLATVRCLAVRVIIASFGTDAMIVIIGMIVVIGAVLAGFSMAGGHVAALLHLSELVTIGGATLGAMIIMCSKKVLLDVLHGMINAIKGSPYSRKMYTELFKLAFELMRLARRDGILRLEAHLVDPSASDLFSKYPLISKNHHAIEFLCDGLVPLVDGDVDTDRMQELLNSELKVIEEEHHAAVGVLQKAADALPGFGIVAAVLGIVITMASIDGPVEEIGHKVGTALVGTFLGILLSYGFFGPLASRMEHLGAEELAFFRTMSTVILACGRNSNPKAAVEQARRGVGSEHRPRRVELDVMLSELELPA